MKKANKLLNSFMLVIFIISVLSACGTNLPASDDSTTKSSSQPSPTQGQSKDEKYIITSEKYGFMLEAPKSWEGKVEIKEDNDFEVTHKTISKDAAAQNPKIFTIVEYGSKDKWEQDSKKQDQPFPYEKLGEIDGKVYAYVLPFDVPYDDKTPEDLKQFTEIINEVEAVLKTFKTIDKASAN